jgi:A/G-specific adenine glycosylase
MSALVVKDFDKKIISWYEEHKRNLPWRHTTDPYKVWLSEIILQQTRVNQGMPYYDRFVKKYPTVLHLAKADEQEVLRLWQGLGYYSRARNLHKCAKEVVLNHQGKLPNSFEELKKLPGIGDYTAAAVASFSFKEPVAVVDGNVYRVMARVFGIDTPINSPKAKKEFFDLANKLLSKQYPDLYNQAVMEFGALHCTPQNPTCEDCVFARQCFAKQKGMQRQLPVKEKKLKVRKRYFYYIVRMSGKSLAMQKREAKDIWQGLYDFELLEKAKPLSEASLMKELKLKHFEITEEYKHVLSHQIILARFIRIQEKTAGKKKTFYSLKKVAELPKPVLISRFLEDHKFLK